MDDGILQTVLVKNISRARFAALFGAYSAGNHEKLPPEVFRIVEKSSTVIAQPEKSWYPRVRTAANGCPVNAISIEK